MLLGSYWDHNSMAPMLLSRKHCVNQWGVQGSVYVCVLARGRGCREESWSLLSRVKPYVSGMLEEIQGKLLLIIKDLIIHEYCYRCQLRKNG